jgi:drug/metabolite transporter (DMT)-like permease
MEVTASQRPAPARTLLLVAAFAAVYIVWGSTYLAIKYAIATMPPLLMAGTRFLLAGGILALAGRASADYERPTLAQCKTSFVVGGLLLVGGNGTVVLAERYIPSSLAALLVATEPFWIVVLGWLWLRGTRPNWQVVLGLLLGFVGVYLLVGEQLFAGAGAGQNQLWG